MELTSCTSKDNKISLFKHLQSFKIPWEAWRYSFRSLIQAIISCFLENKIDSNYLRVNNMEKGNLKKKINPGCENSRKSSVQCVPTKPNKLCNARFVVGNA